MERQDTARRFWSKVDRRAGLDGCWLWVGARLPSGYGCMWFRGHKVLAHRLMLESVIGRRLGSGECALHHCDTPSCVRPDHVFLGDHQDNMADKARKGRGRNQLSGCTHCKRGHAFTAENTYITRVGTRQCRACVLSYNRAARAQRKAHSGS